MRLTLSASIPFSCAIATSVDRDEIVKQVMNHHLDHLRRLSKLICHGGAPAYPLDSSFGDPLDEPKTSIKRTDVLRAQQGRRRPSGRVVPYPERPSERRSPDLRRRSAVSMPCPRTPSPLFTLPLIPLPSGLFISAAGGCNCLDGLNTPTARPCGKVQPPLTSQAGRRGMGWFGGGGGPGGRKEQRPHHSGSTSPAAISETGPRQF